MTTDPGISVRDAATDEWIKDLPEKDLPALVRDQLILLNAIHQSLVLLQRSQLKLIQAVDAIADLQADEAPVRVNDVDMSFASMVVFIIKWSLAMIPAVIILAFLVGLVLFVLRLLGWLPPVLGF